MTLNELQQLQSEISIPEVSVDIWKDKYVHLSTKQMDNARYILITVTDNLIQKKIDLSSTVNIRIKKPDGKAIFDEATIIEDGRVLVKLTDQIVAVSGCAEMDLQIQNGDNVISTNIIHLDILSTPYPNTTILSTDEFNVLDQTIAEGKRINEELKEKETVLDKALEDINNNTVTLKNILEDIGIITSAETDIQLYFDEVDSPFYEAEMQLYFDEVEMVDITIN